MSTVSSEFESTLKLKNLICLNSSTKRVGTQDIPETINMQIKHSISITGSEASIDLGLKVFADDETFEAEVVMRGIFEIDNVSENIVKQNTIAIIFPYIRSQMSLITTQPGMAPVIVPALNIIAMLNADADTE